MSTIGRNIKPDQSGITLTPTKSSDHFLKYGRFVAQTLWNNGTIIVPDVSIELPCGSFKAHKLVLACHSDYFKKWLNESLDTKICDLKVLDYNFVTSKNFFLVLKFLYTGGITLKKDNIREILLLSEKLGMEKLHTVCEWANELLKRSVIKPETQVYNYKISQLKMGNGEQNSFPQVYLGDTILTEDDLKDVTVATLNQMLEQDQLNCRELDKFKIIMKWKDAGENRDQYLPVLLRYLNFDRLDNDDKIYCCQKLETFQNCSTLSNKILKGLRESSTPNHSGITPTSLSSQGAFAPFDHHVDRDEKSSPIDIPEPAPNAVPNIRKQKFYKGEYNETNNQYPIPINKLSGAHKEEPELRVSNETISKEWDSSSNSEKQSWEEKAPIRFADDQAQDHHAKVANKKEGKVAKKGTKKKPKSKSATVKGNKIRRYPLHSAYSYSASSGSELSMTDKNDNSNEITPSSANNSGASQHNLKEKLPKREQIDNVSHSPCKEFSGSDSDNGTTQLPKIKTDIEVKGVEQEKALGSDTKNVAANLNINHVIESTIMIPNREIRKEECIKIDATTSISSIPYSESYNESFLPRQNSESEQENIGIPVYLNNRPFAQDYEMVMMIEEDVVNKVNEEMRVGFTQNRKCHNYHLTLQLQEPHLIEDHRSKLQSVDDLNYDGYVLSHVRRNQGGSFYTTETGNNFRPRETPCNMHDDANFNHRHNLKKASIQPNFKNLINNNTATFGKNLDNSQKPTCYNQASVEWQRSYSSYQKFSND